MAKQALNGVLQHLRKVAAVQTYTGLSDRGIAGAIIGERDETAFTRRDRTSWPDGARVCQRACRIFTMRRMRARATFLVLAPKRLLLERKRR